MPGAGKIQRHAESKTLLYGGRFQTMLRSGNPCLGTTGPRWSPCWPHEPCYQGGRIESSETRTVRDPRMFPRNGEH